MTRLAELIGKAKRAITRDGQTVSQKLETAQYALPLPARLSTLIEHDGDDLRDLPLIDRKRREQHRGVGSATDGSPATSPSIRNDCALKRAAASTIARKWSAQSWPLRVKQRTRGPSRRTISR
jgi:hypothetical protein